MACVYVQAPPATLQPPPSAEAGASGGKSGGGKSGGNSDGKALAVAGPGGEGALTAAEPEPAAADSSDEEEDGAADGEEEEGGAAADSSDDEAAEADAGLLGQRISIWWTGNRRWFPGTVVGSRRDRSFRVHEVLAPGSSAPRAQHTCTCDVHGHPLSCAWHACMHRCSTSSMASATGTGCSEGCRRRPTAPSSGDRSRHRQQCESKYGTVELP